MSVKRIQFLRLLFLFEFLCIICRMARVSSRISAPLNGKFFSSSEMRFS